MPLDFARDRLRSVAFTIVAMCLLAGWLIARSPSVDFALAVSAAVVLVSVAVVCPPFVFFGLAAIAMNLFGFVDLDLELITDLKASDVATIALLAILLIRRGVFRRGDVIRTLAVQLLIPICILLGLAILTVMATSKRWDQPLWLSIKGSKPFLYYSIALLGGMLRLSDKDIAAATRWIVLASCIASAIIVVGFFVPLDDVLTGARVVGLSHSGSESIGYRTIIPGFAFVFFALFIAFHDSDTHRTYERRTVLVLTTLATVCMAFRSFWAGIAVALVFAIVSHRISVGYKPTRFVTTIAAMTVLTLALYATGGIAVVAERLAAVSSDTENRSGSVYVRIGQVRNLLPLLEQYPLFGVGFPHTEGIGASIAALTSSSEIGTYDVGLIDILIKFGILGSVMFFLAIWLLYKRLASNAKNVLGDAARSYIICGIVSLPGAAMFSWPGGIVPLSLAVLLLSASTASNVVEETPLRPSALLAQ